MFETITYTWIFTAIVVVFSFIKWYVSRNDDYWKKRGVPHIPRASFYKMYKETMEKGFADIVKSSLKPYGQRVIGSFEFSTPTLTVADPDLLRDIFVKDFHIFPYRRDMMSGDPIGDKIVFSLSGEDWKRIRTIITPAFTSKRMRQMGSIINDCTKTVLEVCEKHCGAGKPVDCKRVFGAFTMDVIASSAFGTKIDSHNDPDNEFVKRVRKAFLDATVLRMMLALMVPWWIWKLIPFIDNPMKMDRDDFFRDVTRNVIKQRKETGNKYNDFLQILMDCADETALSVSQEALEDETDRFGSITNSALSSSTKYKKLSENELLAQCVLFFLVGYETTATMLTFVAYCLATNPEWQEKLIKEVDESFEKHAEMSYDAVRDMKILDAVISETLRKHPPLLVSERTAVEDYKLGDTGIMVEKDMRVVIPLYAIHYDPDFYQDPETFNPERFMDSFEPKHPQYAYLPFGAGPRNCLGMRFALLEMKMCITNILRHFRIKPLPTTKVPLENKKTVMLLTVSEMPLRFEKRTDVK
ncbi:cytochrome P450 3A7 [Nephila pilipes]|uniref:Cytochrome P450 3A7 n=1 Tax=Nephila pilipes TaxID=299642 RepID=A0A8X6QFR0_NEPPI|nr:cytochrome P450 3A7 [Nephila pilipes]